MRWSETFSTFWLENLESTFVLLRLLLPVLFYDLPPFVVDKNCIEIFREKKLTGSVK